MKHSPRFSRSSRRLAIGASLFAACWPLASAVAVDAPAVPRTADPVASPAIPAPEAPAAEAPAPLLGETYEGKTAGISFTAPAVCERSNKQVPGQIVEYFNVEKQWSLRVTRLTTALPIQLESTKDKENRPVPGLIETTVGRLELELPGTKVLRSERINVGANDCGLIAMRYTKSAQRWLRQQALLQVNDQLYYVFNLTTPAGKLAEGADDLTAPPDPSEKVAVDTFNAMLDTIKLMDRSEIKADQVGRLYRTRAMFVNWSPDKFRQVVIDPNYHPAVGRPANEQGREQFFLIFHSGQIIGYSHELDLIENRDGHDGVVVYTRSHTEPDKDHIVDVGSNLWMSYDRRSEKWVRAAVTRALDPRAEGGWAENHSTEVGTMEWVTKMSYAPLSGVLDPETAKDLDRRPLKTPPPAMRPAESHTLDVNLLGKTGNADPVHKDLPPFYLPQAAGNLLPRLLLESRPYEKRTYMFATFIGENREVMMRYVDVDLPRKVAYNKELIEAVPVTDRIGLEGSATVHYITLDGKYLYAENKDASLIFMPTTEEALRSRWKDVDFSKQEDVPTTPGRNVSGSADPVPARGQAPVLR